MLRECVKSYLYHLINKLKIKRMNKLFVRRRSIHTLRILTRLSIFSSLGNKWDVCYPQTRGETGVSFLHCKHETYNINRIGIETNLIEYEKVRYKQRSTKRYLHRWKTDVKIYLFLHKTSNSMLFY